MVALVAAQSGVWSANGQAADTSEGLYRYTFTPPSNFIGKLDVSLRDCSSGTWFKRAVVSIEAPIT